MISSDKIFKDTGYLILKDVLIYISKWASIIDKKSSKQKRQGLYLRGESRDADLGIDFVKFTGNFSK